MSKQVKNKEAQGFQKKCPNCANCIFFSSNKFTENTHYGKLEKEIHLRCSLGGFKVGKSNWCTKHEFKKELEI